MNFGRNTNKFKSGFGKEGSAIIPEKTRNSDFYAS